MGVKSTEMNRENIKTLIETIEKSSSFYMGDYINQLQFSGVAENMNIEYCTDEPEKNDWFFQGRIDPPTNEREDFHFCGTPACIFGHVLVLSGHAVKLDQFRDAYDFNPYWTGNMNVAQGYLGLPEDIVDEMCHYQQSDYGYGYDVENLSKDDVLGLLRAILKGDIKTAEDVTEYYDNCINKSDRAAV